MPTASPAQAQKVPNDGPDRLDDGGDSAGAKRKTHGKTTKDLSHVPCKFFKVGSCTAGPSCPFSHHILEPGQAKEPCAWFVKGNCKFGHKCALAHILPGQSMAMDRKNKKAAQQLAAGTSKHSEKIPNTGARSKRNPLLSTGSTAPTRTNRLPTAATISPSAPAPPVKDTEFASFGIPDESNKLPVAPAQGKSIDNVMLENVAKQPTNDHNPDPEAPQEPGHQSGRPSPSPLPTHATSIPRRVSDASAAVDFGPIGSPPRASSSNRPARINGFSPGTSPQPQGLSSSPFSAPGTQMVFAVPLHDDGSSDFNTRSNLSASLGTTNWASERVVTRKIGVEEAVVEDEDLEEFLPSSLTDLLTPEERSRRMSRTNISRPGAVGLEREPSTHRSGGSDAHHRYSRSVPAPSLLQEIKSIWSDASGMPVGSPDAAALAAGPLGGGLGNGTPSSFTSNSGLNSRTMEDVLSPSNASAAFLPGLHHYINAKPQRPNMVSGLSSMYGTGTGMPSSAYGPEFNGGVSMSPRAGTYNIQPPNDGYLHAGVRPGGRPIPGGDVYAPVLEEHRSALSPSSRALQAHQAGQSLPQGLAAGYSRIHALPPPVIPSPSSSSILSRTPLGGGFSPGAKVIGHGHTTSGDWISMSPTAGSLLDQINNGPSPAPMAGSSGGLESMFSRLSYSAAAPRTVAPGGMGSRNPSGRGPNPQGSLSPLSRPVPTSEDDDLFSME